jgi:putative flavoprotein involved in K+ transport
MVAYAREDDARDMTGKTEDVETVIVGGGHAGLTMSYSLSQLGQEHVILERGQVGERWRSERWDSFHFQFPNWTIELAGYKYQCDDPDAFAPGHEVVRFLDGYADFIKAPVRCGVAVRSLEQGSSEGRYLIRTQNGTLEAATVVIATGPYQQPVIPTIGAEIPADIFQVHSNKYRNPDQLPPGAILVVGAGSSGCQITEDLIQNERRVYLSVGRHRRVPRRYRGRDFAWWGGPMGSWEQTVDTLPSPPAKNDLGPLLTPANGGHDVDLRRMAPDGVTLLGRIQGIAGSILIIADDLQKNLADGDLCFADYKKRVDKHVSKARLTCPEETSSRHGVAEPDDVLRPIREVDLKAAGISSIVWATGFRSDYDWVKLPIFNNGGEPVHQRGVTSLPGIYFLEIKWLYKRKSHFLANAGPAEDAAYIAEHIKSRGKPV